MSTPPLSPNSDITHFEQPILHKNEGVFGQNVDGKTVVRASSTPRPFPDPLTLLLTQPDRQRQLGARERSGASKLRHDILCGIGEFAGTVSSFLLGCLVIWGSE